MFKKMLMIGASALLATAATTASAISSEPLYDIAPLSGSIKVVGSDHFENGSSKFFKETGDTKKLIRIALGDDLDTPTPAIEKTYVLALANPRIDSCAAELVVWDKLTQSIKAEVAVISATDCDDEEDDSQIISNGPANGKAGTYQEYFTLNVQFIGNGDTSCGTLDTGNISGDGYALGLYTEKNTVSNQNTVVTPASLAISGVIGDLHTSDDEHLVVTTGSFKADLNPAKTLGTSSAGIKLGCLESGPN